MSKEYRRDSINNELDKLQEQMKLLNKLGGLLEEQQSRNLSISKQMEIQNDILETRRKLEAQGLKNLQTQFAVDTKAIETDKRIAMLYDERLRLQESISREKERQAKIDADNARKERQEREAHRKSEVERISNLSKEAQIKDYILDIQSELLDANKDLSDSEKQRLINEDRRVKILQKQLEISEKQKKSKQVVNKAVESINIPGVGSVGSLKEFSEMKLGAQIFTVAVDTFNQAVSTFVGVFKQGYENISNNANSHFTNISTRTGMSYGTYGKGIAGMRNTLKSWNGYDLQDNLKTSEIQNMMNNLANTGIGQEQLFASAIETALTKSVVPYLDLTSSEMQQFNLNVNGELMKQVRGIAKVNQDMFGGNEVATKYLQQQLDYLAPISAVAELDLIQNSEQMMGYYQELRSRGLSDAQIAREISTVRKIQTDAYGVLQNGSTADRLAVITGVQNNRNFAEDSFGIATDVGYSRQTLANIGPKDGSITSYAYYSNMGMEGQEGYELSNSNFDRNAAIEKARKAGASLNNASKSVTEGFAAGRYQTNRTKQETYIENISTEVAMIRTDFGIWFDTLTKAVSGIAKILLAWGIGKITGLGNLGRRNRWCRNRKCSNFVCWNRFRLQFNGFRCCSWNK